MSYSADLRERAVLQYEHGHGTRGTISKLFQVGIATLGRWIRQYREEGTFQRKSRSGGRSATITPERHVLLMSLVLDNPDYTLTEIAAEAERAFGVPVSVSMVFRALRSAAITRKKKTLTATERETPRVQRLREVYLKSVQSISIKDFVFLDECGVSIQMTRTYGRAPRGKRVKGSVPANWGRTTTIIGAITIEGILAAMHIESPTDKAVFLAFLKEVLVPELRPGQVVVMDNLSPHKVLEVQHIIEKAQCHILYLPPYSPDLNPIEQCWSKIKGHLRGAKAREQKTLSNAISDALSSVSSRNSQGWFRNCGYMPDAGRACD